MKVAIVGCGQIADAHIQEVKKIPGVEVAAVCDLNIHMAEQTAIRFGISGIYTSIDTMLKEVRPAVVHVTTPPKSHFPLAKTVLKYGAHAYIEKPFTVNLTEAEELIDNAVRAGKLVCVGHNNAFDSAFLRMNKLYEQGRLGDIVHVDAVMTYNLDGPFGSIFLNDATHWLHQLPGGLAQNNISHPLSLILAFLKDENPAVYARGFRWRKDRCGDIRDRFFDELRVIITGREVTAHMLFSCHSRPVQLYVVVHGTKCQAIANIDARTMRIVEGSSLPGPFAKVQWAQRDAKQAKKEYRRHIGNLLKARLHYLEGMNELFRRFYWAIEGKGEMPIPMSEAVRTTAIMDEIIQQCHENDPEAKTEAQV